MLDLRRNLALLHARGRFFEFDGIIYILRSRDPGLLPPMIAREFVSYPKSGRTWIRYILSELNCDQQILFHHDHFEFSDGGRPPHSFDISSRLEYYGRIEKLVYLDRDPRDVMVSLYHQVTGRFGNVFGYTGNLAEFIRDDYFGAANLKGFRDIWQVIVDRCGFLTISYEACHRDTKSVLEQILDYYQISFSESKLSDAILKGSFENMRNVETSMRFSEPWLRYRNNSPKVRQGKVGEFHRELSEHDVGYLNDIFGLSWDPP